MKNNLFYLLFRDRLPVQDGVVVVRLIGPDLRPDESGLYEMLRDDLQRLSVPLVHGQQKERHHDDDHAHGCQRDISELFKQKKRRHTDECGRPETDKLSFGQVEQYF